MKPNQFQQTSKNKILNSLTKKSKTQTTSPRFSRNQVIISPRISRNVSIVQTIRSRNLQKESQEILNQDKKNQNSSKKLLPLLLKELFNQVLSNYFSQFKYFAKIQKIGFGLLQSKQQRNMRSAFFSIQNHTVQNSYLGVSKIYYHKSTFLSIFLCKFLTKQISLSFNKIKALVFKRKKLDEFIIQLNNFCQRSIIDKLKRSFFIKFFLFYKTLLFQQKYIQKISLLQHKCQFRCIKFCFNRIIKHAMIVKYKMACDKKCEIKKQMTDSSTNVIKEQKQRVKKLKQVFDVLNLQKNRSINQLKKSRQTIKKDKKIDIRSLLEKEQRQSKQLKQMNEFVQRLKQELRIRQDQKLMAQKQSYFKKILNIYSKLKQCQQISQKNTQNIVFDEILNEEWSQRNGNETSQLLFYQNLQLSALVSSYEGVYSDDNEEINADYQQKLKENRILKKIVETLVKREYDIALKSLTHQNKQYSNSLLKLSFGKQKLNENSFQEPRVKWKDLITESCSQNQTSNIDSLENQSKILPCSSVRTSKNSSQTTSNFSRVSGKITSKALYSNH